MAPAQGQPGRGLPDLVATLAADVVTQYQAAESQLIHDSAAIIRDGTQHQQGVGGRLTMLRRLQDAALRVAYRLMAQSGPLSRRIVDTAAAEGEAAAERLIRREVERHPSLHGTLTRPVVGTIPTPHAMFAANTISLDLESRLGAAAQRVTRFAQDAYQAAVADAAKQLVLFNATPAEAQNLAWRDLTRRGVSGFTDARGREWNLATYVEMAVRTAGGRAFNDAHLARMSQNGVAYFTVAGTGRPCKLCFPWEGMVLSDAHPAGETTTLSAVSDDLVTFTVAATIDEARAAGLQHPNCGHTFVPYLPGVTRPAPAHEWGPEQEAAYQASQRLRALEREVRAAKLEALGAVSKQDARAAAANVRAAQARIREHVAQTGVMRRPRREQINLGNKPE